MIPNPIIKYFSDTYFVDQNVERMFSGKPEVELLVSPDNKTIWININNVCVYRLSGIHNLEVNDQGATSRDDK